MIVKTQQLQLIEATPIWKLDDHTKEIGRQGLTNARAILRSAKFGPADISAPAAEETAHPKAA